MFSQQIGKGLGLRRYVVGDLHHGLAGTLDLGCCVAVNFG